MAKQSDFDKKAKKSDVSISGRIRFGDHAVGSGNVVSGSGRVVATGGGAFIGGNVNTGGGDFVGRDKVTYGQHQNVSLDGFLKLLTEMRKLIAQAGLDEKRVHYVVNDIEQIEKEAQSDQPFGQAIVNKFESINSFLRPIGNLNESGRVLLALVDDGAARAKRLFS